MTYRYFIKRKVGVSRLLLFAFLFQIVTPTLAYAGEGPAQPEAASFEPVDSSDLVNLLNGNFNYNLPLMEVPGPSGSFPLNLFYHAGASPSTEASWVGLGWNLNPGSINRFVSGYPDDYHAGEIESQFVHEKIESYQIRQGISYAGFGMGLTFDSNTGKFGPYANFSLRQFLASLSNSPSASVDFGPDLQVNIDQSGVGISATLSGSIGIGGGFGIQSSYGVTLHSSDDFKKPVHSFSASLGFSMNNYSTRIMGVSWNSASSGASFSGIASGFNSGTSVKGQGTSRVTANYGASIPTPVPGLMIDFGYSEQEWWLNEVHNDKAFGLIHQESYLDAIGDEGAKVSTNWGEGTDNIIEKAVKYGETSFYTYLKADAANYLPELDTGSPSFYESTKMERNLATVEYTEDNKDIRTLLSSVDNYVVNGLGVSGTFQPYFKYSYKLYDDGAETGKFSYYTSSESQRNTGNNIKFRFSSDQGSNFISLETQGDLTNLSSMDEVRYGSNKIKPALNLKTGTLMGFEVTAPDGKIYEFYRPVMSYLEGHITLQENKVTRHEMNLWIGAAIGFIGTGLGTKEIEEKKKFMSSTEKKSPYATSWLLTGIKYPDYVDRGDEGFSMDDWGFWININYEESDIVSWRTPKKIDTWAPSATNKNAKHISLGIKERTYLKSIETATHIAFFNKEDRKDNIATTTSNFHLEIPNRWQKVSQGVYDVTLHGNKRKLRDMGITHLNFRTDFSWNTSGLYKDQDPISLSAFTQSGSMMTARLSFDDTMNYMGSTVNLTVNKVTAKAELSNFSETSPPKRLSSINLCKKVYNGLVLNEAATKSNKIESVSFSQNYSLCKGTPLPDGSTTGKLTLVKVEKSGKSGINTIPPYEFEYGFNPNYDENKWDLWNGYTSEGTQFYHVNSQEKSQADLDASAWSLKTIKTPLGSTIDVELESDQIHLVKNDEYGKLPFIKGPTYFTYTGGNQSYIEVAEPYLSNYKKLLNSGYNEFSLDEIRIDYYYGEHTYYSVNDFSSISAKITSITGSKVYVTLEQPLKTGGGSQYWAYNYFYSLKPNRLFAGGHRVKSISISDMKTTKKTLYKYGKGVTASLPALYFDSFESGVDEHVWIKEILKVHDDYMSSSFINKYSKKFISTHSYNNLGPGPSVMYDKVESYEVDENEKPLNGKTVYSYYTAKDFPFTYTNNGGKVVINDKTGIYGKQKSIEYFGYNTLNNEFYPVQKQEILYSFSNDLFNETSTPINGNTADKRKRELYVRGEKVTDSTKKLALGVTRQNHVSHYKTDDVDVTYNIEYIKQNVFLVGSKTTNYMYPYNSASQPNLNSKTEIQTVGYVNGFDALSGASLVSESISSRGERSITETTPAYWNYSELEDKNMLSQTTKSDSYLLSKDDKDYFSLSSTEKKSRHVGSSVTTWKEWTEAQVGEGHNSVKAGSIWRQDDTYVSTKTGTEFNSFEDATKNVTTNFTMVHGAEEATSTKDITATFQSDERIQLVIFKNSVDPSVPHPANYSNDGGSIKMTFTDHSTYEKSVDKFDTNKKINLFVPTGKTVNKISITINNPRYRSYNPSTGLYAYGAATLNCSYSVYKYGDFPQGWKRTSNITAYDRFSHPVEERGLDGTYTSSIYGFGDALPIAIAKNAKRSEIQYLHFETGTKKASASTVNIRLQYAKTGESSSESDVVVKGNVGDIISYWTKAKDTSTTWNYVQAVATGANQTLPVNGGYIDDVRIYPKDATMSTFMYDPLTWKVTAISDANNVTTYYEYDAAGRLIKVIDEDNNLIQKHDYRYGRGVN